MQAVQPAHSEVGEIAACLGDGDWKERSAKVQKLQERLQESKKDLKDSETLSCVLNAVLLRCADQNQRVVVISLQTLTTLLTQCHQRLNTQTVSDVLRAISGPLGSSQSSVIKEAHTATASLVSCSSVVDVVCAVGVVLGSASHHRAKVYLLSEMCSLVPQVEAVVIKKHVLPVAFVLMSHEKADVKQANRTLLLQVHARIGTQIFDAASALPSQETQQQLRGLLEAA